jgi:hypothetical protein
MAAHRGITFSNLSIDVPNTLLPPYKLSAASQAFDITP